MPTSGHPQPDELRAEYTGANFKNAVRGKYADKVNLVRMVAIEPDLALALPTPEAVNEALRALLQARKPVPKPE